MLFPLFKNEESLRSRSAQRGRHVARDDLISLDARRNRSLRAVMAKACCFVRTIKGLSCYLLAVMEVMLLTVLCSHFMRINVAPPVCQLSPSRGSNAKGYITRNIIIIRHPFPSCGYSSASD